MPESEGLPTATASGEVLSSGGAADPQGFWSAIRESLRGLLESIGFAVETFPSAQTFLDSKCLASTDCLILDVRMPGMRGPDLRRELYRRGNDIPTVFITAHGDEDIRPRVLSEGAVDCLLKPFSEAALLGAIRKALAAA